MTGIIRLILLFLCLSLPAHAQQPPVIQSGTVTPGHPVQWTTDGVVQDAGAADQGTLTSLGITAQGPSLCLNSDLVINPFVQLCLGSNTSSAVTISVQNFGGATPQTLCFVINGSQTCFPLGFTGTFAISGTAPIVVDPTTGNISCSNFTNTVSGCVPGSGGGTTAFLRADGSWASPAGSGFIAGPGTSTVGDIVTWNNTTGTLVADTPILPVAHGGTNGGVASGTLLDNITAFAGAGMMARTGAGAYAFRAITGSSPIVVTNGDGVAGAPAVSCPTCGTGSGTVTSIIVGSGLTGGTITTTGTIAADVATNGNIWGGTANKIIDAAGVQSSVAVTAQAISTATFTPNFANYINFSITLSSACPCTLANPSGAYNGLAGFIEVIQDGSGSRTITTYGSTWKFSGGTKPTLSTAINAKDVLPFFCDSSTFCMVGAIQTAFQ